MKDSRFQRVVYKEGGDLKQEFKKNLQKKKETPEIQVQILKFNEMDYNGRLHVSESCCSKDETLFRKLIFRYLSITLMARKTKTSLDVLQEATIDDYWNMDGDKSLSEPWIGVTRFALLNKNPPERYIWVLGRLTKKQVTARLGFFEIKICGQNTMVKHVNRFTA